MNALTPKIKTAVRSFLQLHSARKPKDHATCSSFLLRKDQSFPNLQRKAGEDEDVEFPDTQAQALPEKCVQVFTCGKLFEKWRKEGRHWYLPKGDISFDIPYVDTGHKTTDDGTVPVEQPVVVALHGSPGSHQCFSYMASFMHERGARVIAPTFPDLTVRKKREFRHSSEEKRELVKDFLATINVPRVDMLMCHSSSLFPGLLMCLENERPLINSLCLINPTAFDNPRALHPFWAIKMISHMYEFPVGIFIATMIGKLIVKSHKNLKGGTHLDHMFSGFTLVASNIPQGAYHFQELLDRKLPVLLAFSENDKLIQKKALYKMAQMMSNQDDIRRYDKDGRMESSGGKHPTRRVLAFENGTHFLYKKYPQLLSENVTSFLFENFRNQQRQKLS